MTARRRRGGAAAPPRLEDFTSWDDYTDAASAYGMEHDVTYALDALTLQPGESVERMREARAERSRRLAAHRRSTPTAALF